MKFKIVTSPLDKETYVIWNRPVITTIRSTVLHGIQISGLLSQERFKTYVSMYKTYSVAEPFREIKCSLSIKAVYKFMRINGVYEKI